jgi:uncharacterized membrane protein HdeD (DUF308 family)
MSLLKDSTHSSSTAIKAPILIKLISTVWIIYGILLVLSAVVTSVSLFSNNAANNEMEAYVQWGILLSICIFAFAFLYIGIQTLKGKAKDTLGNGIASIALAAFGLYSMLQQSDPGNIDVVALIPGVILLIAGIFALIGRAKYKEYVANKHA